jgi:hypothetical protein
MDKGSQKGTNKGAETQGVHSSLFLALFRFLFFSDFIQYRTLDQDFLDFTPFLHVEIDKGKKKPREKQWEYNKGRKKGAKKGGKKATVNNPIGDHRSLLLSLSRRPLRVSQPLP